MICELCDGEKCPYCGGPERDYHTMCVPCRCSSGEEHFIGNEEVSGSNPGCGSMKLPDKISTDFNTGTPYFAALSTGDEVTLDDFDGTKCRAVITHIFTSTTDPDTVLVYFEPVEDTWENYE